MEVLAENRFTITKSLFFEGMLRISRDGYGKFAKKSMAVLSVLWLALFIFALISGGDVAHALLFLVILALIGWWLCVLMPRSNARRAYRTLEQKSGGQMERVTRFYSDRLEIGDGKAATVIPYSAVLEMKTSRRLLVLTCRDKVGILLALDGFTNGNEETIRALIESAKDKECIA